MRMGLLTEIPKPFCKSLWICQMPQMLMLIPSLIRAIMPVEVRYFRLWSIRGRCGHPTFKPKHFASASRTVLPDPSFSFESQFK